MNQKTASDCPSVVWRDILRFLHLKIWKSKFSESRVTIFIRHPRAILQTKWIVTTIWAGEGFSSDTRPFIKYPGWCDKLVKYVTSPGSGDGVNQPRLRHGASKYAQESARIPRRLRGGGVMRMTTTKMTPRPPFISTTLLLLLLLGSVSATGKWTFIIQDYITWDPT